MMRGAATWKPTAGALAARRLLSFSGSLPYMEGVIGPAIHGRCEAACQHRRCDHTEVHSRGVITAIRADKEAERAEFGQAHARTRMHALAEARATRAGGTWQGTQQWSTLGSAHSPSRSESPEHVHDRVRGRVRDRVRVGAQRSAKR